jgi:hypothetical protein
MTLGKRRSINIALIFMLAIANFTRLKGNENIRTIQFISIFIIGALFALLIRELVILFREKK